jgi:hypothetical protein
MHPDGKHTDKNAEPIASALEIAEDELSDVLRSANDAGTHLACLKAYRATTATAQKALYCDPSGLLNDTTFGAAKSGTLRAMNTAASMPLPFAILQDTDRLIKAGIETTLKEPDDTKRQAELKKFDGFLSRQTVLNTAIDDAQKAQAALLATSARLNVMLTLPQKPSFTISEPKDYASSIDISSQETMDGEKTSLATVSIVWRHNPWEVSTGILFSTLQNRSYTNVALFENGAPVLNDEGKSLTQVQESIKRPAVLFPVVMIHYKLPKATWLMGTGGIGLNLGTTTPEFVVGPSIKVVGVTFSFLAHYGRETSLSDGVKPGDKLGVEPPAPPTETHWVGKPQFGFAISYAIPFS